MAERGNVDSSDAGQHPSSDGASREASATEHDEEDTKKKDSKDNANKKTTKQFIADVKKKIREEVVKHAALAIIAGVLLIGGLVGTGAVAFWKYVGRPYVDNYIIAAVMGRLDDYIVRVVNARPVAGAINLNRFGFSGSSLFSSRVFVPVVGYQPVAADQSGRPGQPDAANNTQRLQAEPPANHRSWLVIMIERTNLQPRANLLLSFSGLSMSECTGIEANVPYSGDAQQPYDGSCISMDIVENRVYIVDISAVPRMSARSVATARAGQGSNVQATANTDPDIQRIGADPTAPQAPQANLREPVIRQSLSRYAADFASFSMMVHIAQNLQPQQTAPIDVQVLYGVVVERLVDTSRYHHAL